MTGPDPDPTREGTATATASTAKLFPEEAAPTPPVEPTPPAAAEDDDTPDALKVHLPAFDGPLDLLLHLIRKNKVDI